MFTELFAGDNFPCMLQKYRQDAEGLILQMNSVAIPAQLPRAQVDFEFGKLQYLQGPRELVWGLQFATCDIRSDSSIEQKFSTLPE